MKIAVWHNLPSGGGKRALYDHVRGLSERGHAIEVFCPETADEDYLGLNAFGAVRRFPLPTKGPPVPWCNRVFNSSRMRRLRQMMWHYREVAREIDHSECDVVFVNSCRFFYMSALSLFLHKPCLIYLGEPYRRHHEAAPDNPWLLGAFHRMSILRPAFWIAFLKDARRQYCTRTELTLEIASAKAYGRILVNSLYSRESVLRAYGVESHVCYLGIDGRKFCPVPIERKEDYFISVGAMGYLKGADRVIRAIARVPARVRPPLRWVSNGPSSIYRQQMESLAKENGVNLTVLADISDDMLVEQLQKARAMIYAPRLEPFGLAPLEANACATPVIGGAEGGLRETVQNGINGLLVEDSTPNSLAQVVEGFLADPVMQARLSEQALDHVRNRWGTSLSIDRIERHLCQMTHEDSP